METVIFKIWTIIVMSLTVKGQTSIKSLNCSGSGRQLEISCGPTEILSELDVRVGSTKKADCPFQFTDDGNAALYDTCCNTSNSTDLCVTEYDRSLAVNNPFKFHEMCIGRQDCTFETERLPSIDFGCDQTTFYNETNVMVMFAECVRVSDIGFISQTVNINGVSTLHLLGQDYRQNSGISASSTSRMCSVETTDCSGVIDIQVLDSRMQSPSDCKQTVTIMDGNKTKELRCEQNVSFPKSSDDFYSQTSYVTITLTNNLGANGGFLWLKMSASNSSAYKLNLNCPAKDRDRSCVSTNDSTTTPNLPSGIKPGTSGDVDLKIAGVFLCMTFICIIVLLVYFLYPKCRKPKQEEKKKETDDIENQRLDKEKTDADDECQRLDKENTVAEEESQRLDEKNMVAENEWKELNTEKTDKGTNGLASLGIEKGDKSTDTCVAKLEPVAPSIINDDNMSSCPKQKKKRKKKKKKHRKNNGAVDDTYPGTSEEINQNLDNTYTSQYLDEPEQQETKRKNEKFKMNNWTEDNTSPVTSKLINQDIDNTYTSQDIDQPEQQKTKGKKKKRKRKHRSEDNECTETSNAINQDLDDPVTLEDMEGTGQQKVKQKKKKHKKHKKNKKENEESLESYYTENHYSNKVCPEI